MICPNQSNRGPLKKEKLKCGSLPTADIVGAVGIRLEAELELDIKKVEIWTRWIEGELRWKNDYSNLKKKVKVKVYRELEVKVNIKVKAKANEEDNEKKVEANREAIKKRIWKGVER